MFQAQIGNRKANYSADDYTNGSTPRLGDLEYDPEYKAFFRFVKASGAVKAQRALLAAGTNKSGFIVAHSAGANDVSFAGVRVPGANDMASGEYGWIQVSGQATFTFSDVAAAVATAVDGSIVTDAAADGKIQGGAGGAMLVEGNFAQAEAVVNVADTDVKASILYSVLR